MKYGLLLLNLGTPAKPNTASVRQYLREFLSDKRVIKLPALLRYLLLYGIILPFRSKRSAKAYQLIWTNEGSPLLRHSKDLQNKLQHKLSNHCQIALGMRYGLPSIDEALIELKHCENLIILPLYPQYSSATTGSSLEKTMQILSKQTIIPSVQIIRDFYHHPSFIKAQAALIKPYVKEHELILFSYHGLPENHLLIGPCNTVCKQTCSPKSSLHASCYRGQCLQTSELLAKALKINNDQYLTTFQSRLGNTKWIEPYTDAVLEDLAAQGIKKLAIACPSFVADCLETLEEIGIRLKEQWLKLSGEQLTLVPSLNAGDEWVEAILDITGLNKQTW